MGRLAAEDMIANASLEQSLGWHLQCNHYPPVPSSMIAVCKRAITLANKGDSNTKIKLPQGVSYKGRRTAPVWALVEQHHLDSFLNLQDSE